MIEKSLDQIVAADLQDLAARQVTERRTLDYKRDLHWRNRDDRKEFVADVLSFSNASGGDLVYGMEEAIDGNGGKLGYARPSTSSGRPAEPRAAPATGRTELA